MIKIILKSLDKITLNLYIQFIKLYLNKLNIKIINLPIKTSIYTILKSPHVDKKSREQFKITLFKTIILMNTKIVKNINLNFFMINKPKNIKLKLKIIN